MRETGINRGIKNSNIHREENIKNVGMNKLYTAIFDFST